MKFKYIVLLLSCMFVSTAYAQDSDLDGILDAADNCIFEANFDQRDTDLDGFGNVCDADLNNDSLVTVTDFLILRGVLNTSDPDADLNGDGFVTVADFLILRSLLNQPPGPSAFDDKVVTIQLSASSLELPSDRFGLTQVTITATAKNAHDFPVEGILVVFSASSGALFISSGTPFTDANGRVSAELSNGWGTPGNRTITVGATNGVVADTIDIEVVGTTLTISGPDTLAYNETANFTLILADSMSAGISNQSLAMSSTNGNALNVNATVTDANGMAQVLLTGTQLGADTLTVTGLGLTTMHSVDVLGNVFAIQNPLEGEELVLYTEHDISILWTKNNIAQVAEQVLFNSTRGTILGGNGDGTADTNSSGVATIQVNSSSAGPAMLSVINSDLTATSVTVEFVADTPDVLDLQANPLTVGVAEQSTITATVRDINGNAVKNKFIAFVIQQDSTGNSFLSTGLAVTDSQGRASTVYTAGDVPSGINGVVIRATVQGNPGAGVTSAIGLTVAARSVDVAIGTGNFLFEPTTSLFAKEWAIIVTDATGTTSEPVANTNVQASIRSVRYHKGFMTLMDVDPTIGVNLNWVPQYAVNGCDDEDTNLDGFLDLVTEDARPFGNANGQMEAGNRATLSALPPGAAADACRNIGGLGGPTTIVQTDDNGIARVCVVYPQSDNLWVDVKITALLSVFGTDYSESQEFTLEASALDLDDESTVPPGVNSPWGILGDWDDPNDIPNAGVIPACQHTN